MSLTIWGGGAQFVGSVTGTTSATLPAHEAGDVIVAFSFRRGSATAPSLPSGWTSAGTHESIAGATSISARLAYLVATTGSTASGTWVNATRTVFVIYRYATVPFGSTSWGDGAAAMMTYHSLYNTLTRSWALAFGAHASSDGDITFSFEALQWAEREHETDPGAIAAGDTNGPTGGGTSGGLSLYGWYTDDSWITVRAELGALYNTGSEFTAYTVPARTRSFARAPERTAGGSVRVLGDLLEVPSSLDVRVSVPGTTLASAMSAAYDLIALAEVAESISTHEGVIGVNGILGYAIEPVGVDALVTLRFAPTTGVITAPGFVLAPLGIITASGMTPTIVGQTDFRVVMASADTVMAGAATVVAGALEIGVPAGAVTYGTDTVTFGADTVTYGGA